jgi:hypothetical protein
MSYPFDMITEWRFKVLQEYPNRIICDSGEFYNSKGKKLNLKPSRGGYLRVRMYNKGKESYKWAHRLVYTAFVGDCTSLHVHHKNTNQQDNYYLNLEGLPPEKHRWHHHNKKKSQQYTP